MKEVKVPFIMFENEEDNEGSKLKVDGKEIGYMNDEKSEDELAKAIKGWTEHKSDCGSAKERICTGSFIAVAGLLWLASGLLKLHKLNRGRTKSIEKSLNEYRNDI